MSVKCVAVLPPFVIVFLFTIVAVVILLPLSHQDALVFALVKFTATETSVSLLWLFLQRRRWSVFWESSLLEANQLFSDSIENFWHFIWWLYKLPRQICKIAIKLPFTEHLVKRYGWDLVSYTPYPRGHLIISSSVGQRNK